MLAGIQLMFIGSKYLKWALGRRNRSFMQWDFICVRRGAEVLFYTSHVRITRPSMMAVNNGSNIPFDQSASLSAGVACCRAMAPLHADRWLTQSSWSSWRMGGEKDFMPPPSRRKDSEERFRGIRQRIDLMVESVSSVKIARNHYIISFHDMKRHN
jgi:hypothetical protein